MKVEYMKFDPSGNLTALVLGDVYTQAEKIRINDAIMAADPTVEQVGFLSQTECRLTMAGGELCGNATRCAAYYYRCLTEKDSSVILVNDDALKTGMREGDIWTEMPVDGCRVDVLDADRCLVTMKGITHLILCGYEVEGICEKELKELARRLMREYRLDDEAVGILFLRREAEAIHMVPVIWVRSVDTLVCENACGSGTIATAMVEATLAGGSGAYRIWQPSGEYLGAEIRMEDGKVTGAVLSGPIKTDRKIQTIYV